MAYLSVSKLSSFAANPQKYQKYRGGAFNEELARKGAKVHERRGGLSWPEQFILLFIALVVLWWML